MNSTGACSSSIIMKVLVDEHSDGWEVKLRERGFEAQNVRKLRNEGMALQADFSVLDYAKSHNMVLVTRDRENIAGCRENGIPCVPLDGDALFRLDVSELGLLGK